MIPLPLCHALVPAGHFAGTGVQALAVAKAGIEATAKTTDVDFLAHFW